MDGRRRPPGPGGDGGRRMAVGNRAAAGAADLPLERKLGQHRVFRAAGGCVSRLAGARLGAALDRGWHCGPPPRLDLHAGRARGRPFRLNARRRKLSRDPPRACHSTHEKTRCNDEQEWSAKWFSESTRQPRSKHGAKRPS